MRSRAMELRRSDIPTVAVRHERCQDCEGNRYVVAAWPRYGAASRFTLLDGTPLARIDDETFEMPGGTRLRRCRDAPFAHWA